MSRQLARGLVGALVAASIGVACMADAPREPEPEPATELSRSVHMQIVAHEDDDFLFMNPDVQNAITAGHGIVTIYLTAGQASGSVDQTMCAAELATARQNGIKAAYARMAFPAIGNAETFAWTRELLVPDPGAAWPHTAERYTLVAAPRIQLIFLNMPDAGSQIGACSYSPWAGSLQNMFNDASYVTDTVVPSCGVHGFGDTTTYCGGSTVALPAGYYPDPFVCNSFEACAPPAPWQTYDRAGVKAVIAALIDLYQPIVVRTLDPQPFALAPDVSSDNPDHTAAARFTDEVLASYHGPNHTARYSVIHYKGYGFRAYPENLGTHDRTAKEATAMVYKTWDPNYRTFADGYVSWYARMYERYPASTTWLERASDGNLVAISVEDRQIQLWVENAVDGTWTGPTTLGSSGPVAPSVTLLARPDGRLQIFAIRLPLEREAWALPAPSPSPRQEVITSIQNPGAAISFGAWQSAGAPGPGVPVRLLGKATASSTFSTSYQAELAEDESTATRWMSGSGDPQWISVDLGASYPLTRVVLQWHTAYARAYQLQVSNDNVTWTDVVQVTDGDGGIDDWAHLGATGRYVRMYATSGATGAGYSLSEFEVYAAETGQFSGTPSAAYDGSGRTFVFARNTEGRLAYSYSSGLGWGPWELVSASEPDIIDGIAAVTRDDGAVEVFVTGRSGQIQHYLQSGTSVSFIDQTSAFPFHASSAPTAAKNQDGRMEIFYREIDDPADPATYGRVVTAWLDPSGTWLGGTPDGVLYGDAGTGPIAAHRRGGTGHIMLFERSFDGRVSATWQLNPNGGFGSQWVLLDAPDEGHLIQEYPAAATDNLGRVVLVVKGSDGKLYTRRESSMGSVGSFGGWIALP